MRDSDRRDLPAPQLRHRSHALSSASGPAPPPPTTPALVASRAINPRHCFPPPLLDLTTSVRSLLWRCMDNRSAIRYLSACKQLRGLYHCFPLTEPISERQWVRLVSRLTVLPTLLGRGGSLLQSFMRRVCTSWKLASAWMAVTTGLLNVCLERGNQPWPSAVRSLSFISNVVLWLFLGMKWLMRLPAKRSHCCDETSRRQPIPRIIQLAGWCDDARQWAYLQHAVMASALQEDSMPVRGSTLPHSLRALSLTLSKNGRLNADMLPPQLTTLAVLSLTELLPGVLPQSLLALGLYHQFFVRKSTERFFAVQPIAAGVLPSQLQRLEITWNRSLADLALPASLTQLDLLDVPNLPVPPDSLPAGLRSLNLTTPRFDPRHLRGALPSNLRRLRLRCVLSEPLTADLLALVPQLEELELCPMQQLAAGLFAPLTQLRLLRLHYFRHPIGAGELPTSLQRLIFVGNEQSSSAEQLMPLDVRHVGLEVELQSDVECASTLLDEFSKW